MFLLLNGIQEVSGSIPLISTRGKPRESLGPQLPRAFFFALEGCSQMGYSLPSPTFPWKFWGFGYGLGSLTFGALVSGSTC